MYDNRENEKQLIRRLINNDETAFCELYASYKERLMYFAMKFLKSPQFAEDVFQDAFASVWQNRRFLNPESPFAPYIYTIIKNRILNMLANIDKEQEIKKFILKGAIDSYTDTENKILDIDLNGILEKAVENLTPQQRRIFKMSREENKSHKEIADELGISIFTVQQHISTSLRVIRMYLTKYSDIYADLILLLICLNA